MKIVIIEGTDNVGKDTVIMQLLSKFPVTKVMHCEKPKSITPKEQAAEQYASFLNLAQENIYDNVRGKTDCVIHNRSWYGEYVYGCMYRQNDPDHVVNMIHKLEEHLLRSIDEKDIVYITLLSNSAEFLVKNDDGLSLSDAKVDKIVEETRRFEKIHELSTFKNKHIIYVNDGESFRTKEDIMEDVMSAIKNTVD